MLPRRNVLSAVVSALILLILITASPAASDRRTAPGFQSRAQLEILDDARLVRGGVIGHDKADSAIILGADGSLEGKFETVSGDPDLQGWTPVDRSASDNHWHVSTKWAANLDPGQPDNHAWWCGDYYGGSCGEGYGHNYSDPLEWWGTVLDPSRGVRVKLTGVINVGIPDVGFDLLTLQAWTVGGWLDVDSFDGLYQSYPIDIRFDLVPEDFVGPGADQVHIRWLFTSDGGYDDEDCLLDSVGAAQLDLIKVEFWTEGEGGYVQIGTVETCEIGDPLQWYPGGVTNGAGNFGQVWPLLSDDDPCRENTTPQVAFIDDGVVVPGTGGYLCSTHCYGPGNFIVNPEGGLNGPPGYISSMVASPQFAWPGSLYDGAILSFDVYRHESLEQGPSPGMVFYWLARASQAGEEISSLDWDSHGFLYYGGPEYTRMTFDITDLLPPAPDDIQVGLVVQDYGNILGYYGTDGTPAPYFDNVRLTAYKVPGPGLFTEEYHQAQDNFPESGTVLLTDLAQNSVRFDMGYNTNPRGLFGNIPGDTLVVRNSEPTTTVIDPATMTYRLFPNPLFDPYRTALPPGAGNSSTDGTVTCWMVTDPYGENTFSVDLPDTGFFYPGDVIHYYFRAVDTEGHVALLPADTTGFSHLATEDFGQNEPYDPTFTVRALPTVLDATGTQPAILVWDDAGSEDEWYAWLNSMSDLNLVLGQDYDLYRTKDPRRGRGNGLGGRATSFQLAEYATLLYSSGEQDTMTLTPSDTYADIGMDVELIWSWLGSGQKTAVLMGDHLVSDLWFDDKPDAREFAQEIMGVSWQGRDVRPEIGGQTTPWVYPDPGDPVFSPGGWGLDGDCPYINRFDHVLAAAPGERAAEFANSAGATGVYSAAAVVKSVLAISGSEVFTAPYGLFPMTGISQVPGDKSDKGAFLWFLADILRSAGHELSNTPLNPGLNLAAWPNPFNPRTEIQFTLNKRGGVKLDLYDLRGRLVRRLLDEVRDVGEHSTWWDGRGDDGRALSSGVYFCIMESSGGRRTLKLTMIR